MYGAAAVTSLLCDPPHLVGTDPDPENDTLAP